MKIVDRAAHKIVQLLQMFEEQHGMRFFPRNMVHVIYECGVVLLKEAATVPFAATKKRATALDASNVCLRVLKGTSRTWPWAERLAGRLEGLLNEAGANISMQPFASNWTVPVGGNDQTGTDTSQTFYQFVHVWDSTGVENSGRSYPKNRASDVYPTQPDTAIHTDPSRATDHSQMGLGLQGLPPSHQGFGNSRVTRGNLGEEGSSHVDGEAQSYDMMSFSGTPSSSSSYSLPPQAQQEPGERRWDPLFH
ncbi:unnamed protein product [Rhizoctonia solani]|uniref:Uncharacterized protein n=1 Tax=Rhizoctonia solani TaxID=456999 RepID=A0A8H3GYB9_9AGAM|nr:unnamed protein product [Rhizoctonia solani]